MIERALAGDESAFCDLVRRYESLVMGLLARKLPADLIEETAQEVLLDVFQSLPKLREREAFKGWLVAIIQRKVFRAYKLLAKKRLATQAPTKDFVSWLDSLMITQAEAAFETEESIRRGRELLNWLRAQLSAEERLLLEFVFLEGLSHEDFGRDVGWSVTNVKVRSHRLRKKLIRLTRSLREQE